MQGVFTLIGFHLISLAVDFKRRAFNAPGHAPDLFVDLKRVFNIALRIIKMHHQIVRLAVFQHGEFLNNAAQIQNARPAAF